MGRHLFTWLRSSSSDNFSISNINTSPINFSMNALSGKIFKFCHLFRLWFNGEWPSIVHYCWCNRMAWLAFNACDPGSSIKWSKIPPSTYTKCKTSNELTQLTWVGSPLKVGWDFISPTHYDFSITTKIFRNAINCSKSFVCV